MVNERLDNYFNMLFREVSSLLLAFQREELIDAFASIVDSDVDWADENDPSSDGRHEIFWRNSMLAIAYYRFSNLLWYEIEDKNLAKRFAEKAKEITSLDIHPAAKIGQPFAIDHGTATVIGETSVIGAYCLFLDHITLGSVHVGTTRGTPCLSGNKRHPTIGNYTTICNHVRVLGPVDVGSNCFIGSYALIMNDIPDDSDVTCVAQLQIWKKHKKAQAQPPIIESIHPTYFTPHSSTCLYVTGSGFSIDSKLELITIGNTSDELVVVPETVDIKSPTTILSCLPTSRMKFGTWILRITNNDNQSFSLTNAITFKAD